MKTDIDDVNKILGDIKSKPEKPLAAKAYGSIPHLPGSRRGPADKGISEQQAAICLTKARDDKDLVIVQEKLDGSCCAAANVGGKIVALQRNGYLATASPFEQHHMFARWVERNEKHFAHVLNDGEWCVGEWLAQAHGTRYALGFHAIPFIIFDIMRGPERVTFSELSLRLRGARFDTPHLLSHGGPCSIEHAMALLGDYGNHGALDMAEGAVWRVEREGKVDFLAKYVRPGKVDGCLLPERNGGEAVWNWREP